MSAHMPRMCLIRPMRLAFPQGLDACNAFTWVSSSIRNCLGMNYWNLPVVNQQSKTGWRGRWRFGNLSKHKFHLVSKCLNPLRKWPLNLRLVPWHARFSYLHVPKEIHPTTDIFEMSYPVRLWLVLTWQWLYCFSNYDDLWSDCWLADSQQFN